MIAPLSLAFTFLDFIMTGGCINTSTDVLLLTGCSTVCSPVKISLQLCTLATRTYVVDVAISGIELVRYNVYICRGM